MARYPDSVWRGPIPNMGGQMMAYRLGVVHVMEGTLAGTDSWFRNPAAQVSAHFGVGKTGVVYQWVDTNTEAWAEADYNPVAISIEHEGTTGESLTPEQITADQALVQWIREVHGIPLATATNPSGTGWIGHGELGVAGGNHPECPGAPILAQWPQVLVTPQPPSPQPKESADMAFQTFDPETGRVLATDKQGNFYAQAGIPDIAVVTLAEHPTWHAGTEESAGANPCVGITPWKDTTGRWGYCYVTQPTSGKGSFGPYDLYCVPRAGL